MARPMPDVAPTTTATRPVRSRQFFIAVACSPVRLRNEMAHRYRGRDRSGAEPRPGESAPAPPLPWNLRNRAVVRIRPAIVGNDRRPARTRRVLVVWIAAEFLVELAVLRQLRPIELDSEARPFGHPDGS